MAVRPAVGVLVTLGWMAAVGTPGPARAWTEAHVRAVDAHVEVRPDGTARVAMELRVRIHAGWLESLEIAGLDPDFSLDETKPPWAVSEDDPALKFEPRVQPGQDGRLLLTFRGRQASPRRGTLRVGLIYDTTLAHRATEGLADGSIRVRWTLPPWRSGLDGVSISMTLPPGATAAADATGEAGAAGLDVHALPDRTVLRWQRAHLPRTVAWTVAAEVPGDAMAPALAAPAQPPRPKRPPSVEGSAAPSVLGPAALAAALGLLVLLGRASFARRCRRAGVIARPWVPLPLWPWTLAVVAGAVGAALRWIDAPLEGLLLLAVTAALSLHRTPAPSGEPPRFGTWRVAGRADLARARRARRRLRLGLLAPVDLTTPVGLLLLAGTAWALWHLALGRPDLRPAPLLLPALGLLALPFLSATRMHLPSSPEERLLHLERAARLLRAPAAAPPFALRLVFHVDGDGQWQDARLRIAPARTSTALLRLDLAVVDRPELGGWGRHLALLAVTREDTVLDEALGSALPSAGAHTAPGARRARVELVDGWPEGALAEVLRVVAAAARRERRPRLSAPAADPRAA